MKSAKPDIEIVITLGNNDFGFNKEGLEYLIETVKNFTANGIHTVCANIFESSGNRPSWLKPYTIVERDGGRNFITGFCIDNLNTKPFGIIPKKQKDVLAEIFEAVRNEKPDNVIVLNHDYMPSSRNLVKISKENGLNIDLVIGGHDHDYVPPDTDLNIYYPKSFSDSMYKMILDNSALPKLRYAEHIIQDINPEPDGLFAKDIERYERESGLFDKIVPYTLNLPKSYSKPCPLGSFMADNMQRTANADAAFISTGFLMKPLLYKPDAYITKYLFKKTITAKTPLKTVNLSAEDIKSVFDNALRTHGYGPSNPRFLQCSNNIKITGKNNSAAGEFQVTQIYINNEPLLDKNSIPIKSSKRYKCAIDSYIAEGGQGFDTLKKFEKSDVIVNGKPVGVDEILLKGLKDAYGKYPQGSEYPAFELID